MGRKYTIRDNSKPYFFTFTVINWIDVFSREIYCQKIIESIKFCQVNKGLEVYSWCIMPSHIHMILGSSENTLEDIVRDFKSFTSRQICKELEEAQDESRKQWLLWMMNRAGLKNSNNNDFQFWQQHNHPIELNSNEKIEQRLTYIHYNPVKAGYVWEPEHWKYSSATDYAGKKGLLDIVFV